MSLRTNFWITPTLLCAIAFSAAIGSTVPPTGRVPAEPVIAMRMLDPISGQHLALIAVDNRNAARFERPRGDGPSWGWPTPTHDIGTSQLRIAWNTPEGLNADDTGSLSIRLTINGRSVRDVDYRVSYASDLCAGKARCLVTEIHRAGWPPFDPAGSNASYVVLTIEHDRAEYSLAANVLPSSYPVSYFSHFLQPTFRHDRCQTCHSGWNDGDELRTIQHSGYGIDPSAFWLEFSSVLTPSKLLIGCADGCHTGVLDPLPNLDELDPRWVAPVDVHENGSTLDFEAAAVELICQQVTSILNTKASREDHFYRDARLLWGVTNPAPPPAYDESIHFDPAPPGKAEWSAEQNYEAWLDLVAPWIDAGAPCPPVPPLPDDWDWEGHCVSEGDC